MRSALSTAATEVSARSAADGDMGVTAPPQVSVILSSPPLAGRTQTICLKYTGAPFPHRPPDWICLVIEATTVRERTLGFAHDPQSG